MNVGKPGKSCDFIVVFSWTGKSLIISPAQKRSLKEKKKCVTRPCLMLIEVLWRGGAFCGEC